MLQGNQSGGEVYFKLLEYFGDAKTKVIIGQTASSGDAGGWSKGQVQGQVRQDILEADSKALSATIKRDILRPWTAFNYGPDAPVPEAHFAYQPPEDQQAKATVVEKVGAAVAPAGYEIDPEWIKDEFGIPVVKSASGRPDVFPMAGERGVKKNASPNPPPPNAPMTRW